MEDDYGQRENPTDLTPQIIEHLYNLLLDRPPEDEALVQSLMGYQSVSALRKAIFDSPEYRQKNIQTLNTVPVSADPISIRYTRDGPKFERMFDHVRTEWSKLGETEPYWSVLSSDEFRGTPDEAVRDNFYLTGAHELARIHATLGRCGLSLSQFEQGFEFGCGLGRTTLALAEVLPAIAACDISAPHLAVAEAEAEARQVSGITFIQADDQTFGMTDPFDFWYSRIVLQHNPPPIMDAILERMFDQLSPGGVALFQAPAYAVDYRFDEDEYLATAAERSGIEMHCIPQPRVFELADKAGARPLEVRDDDSVDVPWVWVSTHYLFQKTP